MIQLSTTTSFPLGRIVATSNAATTLSQSDILTALSRHAKCDWGDLCDDDKLMNELALADGTRLVSSYTDAKGTKFWIITEADRTETTILLPEDY